MAPARRIPKDSSGGGSLVDDYVKSVPDDWRHDRLKDVASLRSEKTDEKSSVEDYLELEDIESWSMRILNWRNTEEVESAVTKFEKGDVLFGKLRPYLAKVYRPGKSGKCTGEILAIHPTHIDGGYLQYALIDPEMIKKCTLFSYGAKMPRVNWTTQLSTFEIPIPPRPEQERIAAFLDEKCATVDKAIEVKRKQLESLEAIWKNLFYRATTQGLSVQTRMVASGNALFPRIPVGWKVVRIKNIGTLRYGLGEPPEISDDGIPMIRATDFRAGKIDDRKMIRINPADLPEGRNAFLRTGEIIVVRSGAYAGDSTIIPAKYNGYISGYYMVVTITKAVPEFIAYAFLSKHILDDQLLLLSLRAAQPHVNAEQVLNLGLPLPPKEEQKKIAVYLSRNRDYLDSLAASLRKQIETLAQYRKSLIHEFVTGVRRVV